MSSESKTGIAKIIIYQNLDCWLVFILRLDLLHEQAWAVGLLGAQPLTCALVQLHGEQE